MPRRTRLRASLEGPSPAYDADAPTRGTRKLLYFKASLQNSRGEAALRTEARHLSFMLQASLHGTRAKNITHTGHSRLRFRDALALIRQGQESDKAGMRLFLAERQHRSILERDKVATLQLQDHGPHRRCMASSNVLYRLHGRLPLAAGLPVLLRLGDETQACKHGI